MNKQETIQVISLLASNYKDISEKDDDQKRMMVNTWMECFKDVEYEFVMKAIKKTILTKIFTPTISEVRDLALQFKKANMENQPKLPQAKCNKCNGTGFVMYKRTERNCVYDCVARCDCIAGNEYNYDGKAVADERHRTDYYIPKISDIQS